MPYLTEHALSTTSDLPIALPATLLKQGDWLVVASTKLVEPMQLSYEHMTLGLLASSVNTALIGTDNRLNGSLGLVYLVLRLNYAGEAPDSSGALDTVALTALGTFTRPTTTVVTATAPGTYSWIIANNMKASNTGAISPSTSIDFRVALTGMARLSSP